METSEVQEALDAVRMRPSMYVGGVDAGGLHHLFKEIIDNAIDEALAGYCTEINVVYNADSSLSVQNNGRGIPIENDPQTGKSFAELVFTQLLPANSIRADAFKVRKELNGIGACCVNALSEWLEYEVRQSGSVYRQRFERGIPVTPLTRAGDCGAEEHGTKVTWLADASIFTALDDAGRPAYDVEELYCRLRELAFLNRGLLISFHDAHSGKEPETFCYERGIIEQVAELNQKYKTVHPDVIAFSSKAEGMEVEIALQYQKGDEPEILCYANTLFCRSNGTHYTGFKTALTRTLNRFAREHGLLTDTDVNLSGDDLQAGLTAVVAVLLIEPSWASTMRWRIVNPEAGAFVSRATGKALAAYWKAHPDTARAIVDHANERRK